MSLEDLPRASLSISRSRQGADHRRNKRLLAAVNKLIDRGAEIVSTVVWMELSASEIARGSATNSLKIKASNNRLA